MPSRLLLASLVALCGACATLDENQCRSGDWRQIGYQDGLRGHAGTRLSEHQKSCAEHGVVGDANAWQIGYVQGQGQFCTARNGYEHGREGHRYGDVCPPEMDALFRPAYTDGRRVSALREEVSALERRLVEVDSRLQDDDRRGAAYLDAVRSGRKPTEPPALLRVDERTRLEREYVDLSHAYHHLLEELEEDDAALSARYQATPLRFEFNRY